MMNKPKNNPEISIASPAPKPKETMVKLPMPGMVPLKMGMGIQEMSAEDRLK